jgi:thiamine-phosphate pyrophosphorylase
MASRRSAEARRPPTRLYLFTPRIGDPRLFVDKLQSALAGGDIAALLLRVESDGDEEVRSTVAALAPRIQRHEAALLLDRRPQLAASLNADGAHLPGVDALKRALADLKPERIAGVGGLKTRHDAMIAAESGADYVMFGEPDAAGLRPSFAAVLGRVAWWAELFEVPCVAYAASVEEAGPLAAGGADFIALGDWAWAGEPAAAVKAAAAAIKPAEEVE